MTPPRHGIVLVVDALRADALSCEPRRPHLDAAGLADLPATPNLDRIAREGVRFARAATAAPYTPAAHASLFTGLNPPAHGVRAFFRTALRPGIPTLAERLEAEGFETFRSDEFGFFPLFGLDQGFSTDLGGEDAAAADALARVHARGGRALLFLHVFDVHEPYGHSFAADPAQRASFEATLQALERAAGTRGGGAELDRFVAVRQRLERTAAGRRLLLRLYLAGVNTFDRGRLARLLAAFEATGALDDSLLVVLADHGEADYGTSFGHGGPLTEDAVRIPLVMRAPGRLPAGAVIPSQVSIVDVAPTVLQALGARFDPEGMDGRSLVPLVTGRESGDREAYAEVWAEPGSYFENLAGMRAARDAGALPPETSPARLNQRMLGLGRWKLVVRGEDPRDATPLPDDPDDRAYVAALYRRFFHREPDTGGLGAHVAALRSGRTTRAALARAFETHPVEGGPAVRLHDVDADPLERHDLLADPTTSEPVRAAAEAMLERLLAIGDVPDPPVAAPALDLRGHDADAIAERMRALGYR